MVIKGTWKTASIVLIIVLSILGEPTCINRFHSFREERLCRAGNDDYVLTRGLVSDSNNTIVITLSNCRITDVEFGAFRDNYNVEDLDLVNNKISYLKPGVFDDMPKLTSLKLSKNLLTAVPVSLFAQLLKLRILDISDNKISYLQLGVFDSLTDLTFLQLSGNVFLGKELDPCIFCQNPKLMYLHLSSNNMAETPNVLSATKKIIVLGLNNCELTEVPKFATDSNLKTVKQLRLQTNKITSLDDPGTFVNFENLVILDLMGNFIDNINENVFKPLSKLKALNLSFNRIKKIPEKLFHGMGSMESIDLSRNLIEIAPVNAFRRTNLDILDLSKNRISVLDRNFCTELTYFYDRLTFLFNDNPFSCACLLDLLNDVKRLGIKYNSEMYNGKDAVCSMTSEFMCLRNTTEYWMNVQQQSTSTDKSDVWSTFGNGYQLGNG